MPEFIGTSIEFKRYIGPRLRNLVQNLTRSHKASVGACESCGAGDALESAHVKGRDRNQIIEQLLAASAPDSIVKVDLESFEAAFRSEHEPLEKSILVLCQSCHARYDSKGDTASQVQPKGLEAQQHPERTGVAELLPITLTPSPVAEFKRQLLVKRMATISIYFRDGRIEQRPWNASGFTEGSNVMGNLRSRPEFRQGNWQRNGIIKVHVTLSKDA